MISEKQAYMMGWVLSWDGIIPPFIPNDDEDSDATSPTEFMRVFTAASWDQLGDRRKIDYLRGVVDHHAMLMWDKVTLSKKHIGDSGEILDCVTSAFTETEDNWVWSGVNIIDFLGELKYNESEYCSESVVTYLSQISLQNMSLDGMPKFKWERTSPDAVPPKKNRYSDAGYDLTLIEKMKENEHGVIYYNTGIKVEPQNGYYFELVGRSSIAKTGWTLANNIGIIDASYRGNIIVALVRAVPGAPEIKLPMRLAQLIPRNSVLLDPVEAKLNDTVRADGGFGSSGK